MHKAELPFPSASHTLQHRMVVFSTEVPRDAALRYLFAARDNIKYYLDRARVDADASHTPNSGSTLAGPTDASLRCSECEEDLGETLYCCLTCPGTCFSPGCHWS